MIKIGLTGGIGVGKSFVAEVFQKMGYPIFSADYHAKKCMQESEELKANIIKEFGKDMYQNGVLQRKKLATIVFNDLVQLHKLNQIVHPYVQLEFENWCKKQTAHFVIKEAAILFESGANKGLDAVICVTAPLPVRIQRVMQRDKCSAKEVLDRIAMQMPQETKEKLADFVIINDENTQILPQILKFCAQLHII